MASIKPGSDEVDLRSDSFVGVKGRPSDGDGLGSCASFIKPSITLGYGNGNGFRGCTFGQADVVFDELSPDWEEHVPICLAEFDGTISTKIDVSQ